MAALSYAEQVQQAYLAYYGRPADPAGQQYWVNQLTAANGNLNSIINAFGNSAESTALYGGSSTAAQVNAIYQTLFGRPADVTGLNYYVSGIVNGQFTLASVALNIYNGATGTDAAELTAKLGYADSFTAALTQSAAGQVAYSGNAAANNARAAVASVVDSTSQATATAALSTTVANIGTGAVAQTFTLTTGVDTLTGTSGNDVFVADNTAGAGKYVSGVADSINGGSGNDTLKIYSDGAAAGQVLPTLNSVESVWINNAGASVDVSKVVGVTSLTLDAAAASITATVANQSVTLSNDTTNGRTYTIASTTDTAESVTLSKVANATANTLDLNGSKVATLNLTATGAADAITLTNTGGALTTLNISGDQKLTLTEGLAGLKTINASTDTAGVSIIDTATVASSFAFTGGSGNDSLSITTASLDALTSGSQLNGGAGTDTLVISDAGTLATADYTALNAATGFEVLGLGGSGAAAVDASKITATFANHYAVSDTGGVTISNLADGATVDITAAVGADSFGAAVGAQTLNLNIGTTTLAGFANIGTQTVTGFSTVNLSSNGTSANGASLTPVTFANSDNTKFVVTGGDDLFMKVAAATATGDKIDASAFTGAFTLTADSGKGDVILTGSGTTTITETSTTKADTITLLAGHTKVNTLVLSAQYAQTDVVNNFVLNQDVIKAGTALTAGTELGAVKGMVASASYANAAAFITAAEALSSGVAGHTVAWYDAANNNTYVAEFGATAANSAHIVELVGVHATAVGTAAATGTVLVA
ncbi:DUF4214 domain-containing protein [Paraburkholderia sp. BL17N1]|uniref:DUF4214 domain-containing protein n=1 Tax=Paraburkholderia sp. BL17N1 TaxID=1938798 RepID=UPI000EACA16C|nr:DUF4214 domain-containing protein [Paraburkholderia sp. BL17N1]RKR36812.1 uncharacterized protein DUF4214 [Paraburkholderia sp. BL17N1]